ncbi:hypothetical protein ABZ953_08220 [Streptomyces sp. NPDC046465]|uniref:hypothetical protein n=1 Tax=Streptomyces sp. NPDC046465 TaxID=3155810 RepID=UPI00340943E6
MTPEMCPFHHVEDTCVPMARLLEHAGLLTLTPDAPALASVPPTEGLFSVPPRRISQRQIAGRINQWGRTTIDPTVPRLDTVVPGERSLRYSLQALGEAVHERGGLEIPWLEVAFALSKAHSNIDNSRVFGRNREDPAGTDLNWYIAALHVERAYGVWSDQIRTTLGT